MKITYKQDNKPNEPCTWIWQILYLSQSIKLTYYRVIESLILLEMKCETKL